MGIGDIGELLVEEVDLEAGQKTSQVLPGVKKREISPNEHKGVKNWEDVAGPSDSVANDQETTLDKTQRVDGETQTGTVVKEVQPGKNRREIIQKFGKDG